MNFGIVISPPEVKFVTTISSKESANARRAPEIRAVRIAGNVTYRKLCQPLAPRSIDASTSDPGVRRSRAITLLNTTTMQKVAWPITIVRMLKEIRNVLIEELRAIAVTIPGRAIGKTRRKDTALRPKKEKRCTANAAALPNRSAAPVAIDATCSDVTSASRTRWLCHVVANHLVV